MLRALSLAALTLAVPTASQQVPSVLKIKVVLVDAAGNATPVPRHALLISENPISASPRRTITALDGTADVPAASGQLPGGVGHSRELQWQGVPAGRKRLTWVPAATPSWSSRSPTRRWRRPSQRRRTHPTIPESDPAFLLPKWRDTVVGLWSPVAHGSGFVIDSTGLIATNQRPIGAATSIEVQLSPSDQSGGDRTLRQCSSGCRHSLGSIQRSSDPITALPLPCKDTEAAAVTTGQELFTVGAPLRQTKGLTSGAVTRLDSKGVEADFVLARASVGGPVFTAKGQLVGLTSSSADSGDDSSRAGTSVVRVEDACAGLAAAEENKRVGPSGNVSTGGNTARDFPNQCAAELGAEPEGQRQRVSAVDIDVRRRFHHAGIDLHGPVSVAAAAAAHDEQGHPAARARTAARAAAARLQQLVGLRHRLAARADGARDATAGRRLLDDGGARRGAHAGIAIPPIKRIRSGFSHMRAYCGEREVTPIHPFRLVQRISDDDAMFEGLYAFDPAALSPECGSVKVVVFSEREPEKGETLVVAPGIVNSSAGFRGLPRSGPVKSGGQSPMANA